MVGENRANSAFEKINEFEEDQIHKKVLILSLKDWRKIKIRTR
jgi:hypothetical protein